MVFKAVTIIAKNKNMCTENKSCFNFEQNCYYIFRLDSFLIYLTKLIKSYFFYFVKHINTGNFKNLHYT